MSLFLVPDNASFRGRGSGSDCKELQTSDLASRIWGSGIRCVAFTAGFLCSPCPASKELVRTHDTWDPGLASLCMVVARTFFSVPLREPKNLGPEPETQH